MKYYLDSESGVPIIDMSTPQPQVSRIVPKPQGLEETVLTTHLSLIDIKAF
jgi:hypothetical protein